MKHPPLLATMALMLGLASSVPAAAQFYYDPDGPPLASYTPRQTWPAPTLRHSHGRVVRVPAGSDEGWRQREEPPVPASQYSLTN